MIPTPEILLSELSPYRDEWVLVHPNQNVKDIISEVLKSHEDFAPDYDRIALYFDDITNNLIANKLFTFCKKYIEYKEEPEESQTTALPAGILTRSFGDCKHYSGFTAGVLDAINRNTGKKIEWVYRFASYNPTSKTPHHVFVVIKENGKEIWIDPTPGAREKNPQWVSDKKVRAVANAVAGVGGNALAQSLLNDDYEAFMNLDNNFKNEIITGFFSNLWRGTKKVTLAVPRNAYLSLVALNVFGLASKLKQAISTESGAKKIADKWYSLGGTPDKLKGAINSGAKKNRILGIYGGVIGTPVAPWVAAATAIIAAMTPLLKSILQGQQSAGFQNIEGYDPTLLNTPDMSNQNPGIMEWVKQHPVESIAIGAAAYFLVTEFVINKKQ